jgi:TolA-binding protein
MIEKELEGTIAMLEEQEIELREQLEKREKRITKLEY